MNDDDDDAGDIEPVQTMVSKLFANYHLDLILLHLAREVMKVSGEDSNPIGPTRVAAITDAAVLRRAIGKLSGVW